MKICDYLRINQTLKKLDIWGSNIGDVEMKYLCDALCKNTCLTFLNLGNNKIGEEGAKCMSRVISTNSTLTYLNLGRNNIGDDGAKYLSDAVATNTTLVCLHLNVNMIGDVGGKYLSDALTANTTLALLSLSGNNISSSVLSSLPKRDVDTHYSFSSCFYIPYIIESYASIECVSLSFDQLKKVIDNVDKSKITKLIVDGTCLNDGEIPPFIFNLTKLKSLRIT